MTPEPEPNSNDTSNQVRLRADAALLLSLKAAIDKSFIGEPITQETKSKLCDAVRLRLQARDETPPKTACTSMWEVMTWKDKVVWFMVNELIPSIGVEIRKQRDAVNAIRMTLESHPTLRFSGSIPKLPRWAYKSPKNIILVDVAFTPQTPTQFITFTTTLPTTKLE